MTLFQNSVLRNHLKNLDDKISKIDNNQIVRILHKFMKEEII